MAETMILIPVRTSRQGTSLNAGKLKNDYRDETSTIEIHGEDMARLGLTKGDRVRMISIHGTSAEVTCKVQKGADAVPGLIFMAYGPTSSLFMEADTAGTGMPLSKQMEITLEGPLAPDGSVIPVQPNLTGMTSNLAASPLSVGQVGFLNALSGSQLSPAQSLWLSGYFAALSGSGLAPGDFTGSTQTNNTAQLPLLTILFGSETGNGEHLAEDLLEQAKAKGFNVQIQDMMDYDVANLPNEQYLLVIVSTQGEGDPPLTAGKLHNYFKNGEAPELTQLKFAVFALGDSSYEFYCQTGKDFDDFLAKTGATRLLDRVDADIDFEEPAEAWIEDVLALYQTVAEEAGNTVSNRDTEKTTRKKSTYSKTNPFMAPMLNVVNLNGEGSIKETCHIGIDLTGSGLSYDPGDALGVYPLNDSRYVEQLLNALHMTGDEIVTLGKEELPLKQAFQERLDITALSRVNMEKFADLTASDALKTLLAKDNSKQFKDYIWGRQILDLVEDYTSDNYSAQDFITVLRRIPARLYSIASSIKAHPEEVQLLVGSVRYNSFERDREGVCSTFLNGRVTPPETLAVYVHANKNFSLPKDSNLPVIMVGPGTGLAPFRSFLEERKATGASGPNWLFFGDQHQACDYLYGDELDQMKSDGLLTNLDLAFSRDQEEKIYVQTRILARSKEIYEWLEKGAYFYICGDAERMAKDVHKALIESVRIEAGIDEQAAESYIDKLLESRRYQRDVY